MSFLKDLKEGQKVFTDNFATIINSILLTIVYFLGIGLTSIFSKIFNKDFLEIKLGNKESYWSELNLSKTDKEGYFKQF